MQEAAGSDQTDSNRSTRQSSADLDTDRRLHSFPGIAFNPPIQACVCRADLPTGIFRGWHAFAPVSAGYPCRAGVAGI
ncbi:MAG: hypothetical protein U1A72_09470 [Sulfuritalea sp.]|nr:hypothetical protein [Sulfuritalea sp.]